MSFEQKRNNGILKTLRVIALQSVPTIWNTMLDKYKRNSGQCSITVRFRAMLNWKRIKTNDLCCVENYKCRNKLMFYEIREFKQSSICVCSTIRANRTSFWYCLFFIGFQYSMIRTMKILLDCHSIDHISNFFILSKIGLIITRLWYDFFSFSLLNSHAIYWN